MNRPGHAGRLAARLGERDAAILLSLREFRLMSGEQLRRLHFGGGQFTTQARKARAALNRLAGRRLVVRLARQVGGVHAGSDGFVYGLSGWGQAVLDVLTGTTTKHRRVIETKPAFQDHTLAIGELAIELYERARVGRGHVDELRAEPASWRRFAGLGGDRRILKPDVFVRVTVGDYELSHFVEMDMATESRSTIARQCRVYVDYYRSGQEQRDHDVFPQVWWLVPDRRRLDTIKEVVRRLPGDAQALFIIALTSSAADQLMQLPPTGGVV
ncbi:replication-relaxation family protein [Amycolatopsis sp. NPDC051128]|uniref:replication-relaxation family protein n=1 Tax=Amycolatopsis sp. NPDC051128 TaxID=3155412 RepID=UPI00341A27DC